MSSIFTTTPRQTRRMVRRCFFSQVVPFVQSHPGIGKSAIMHNLADELNLEMLDVRLSMADPTDLSGFPMMKGDFATFAPFDMFPTEQRPLPEGKSGWLLFFDEFNSAPKSVQAAAYKIILDKMVGMHRLHSNVVMAAAGNLATSKAIVNPLSTAMQSRLVHLEMECNFGEWMQDVALANHYDPRIIAYLNQYPDKLMDFRPDHQDKTFSCPRTWEFMNRLIKNEEVEDVDIPLYAGTITSTTAAEFVEFTKVFHNLVRIEQVIANPTGVTIPGDISSQWATVARIGGLADEDNLGKIIPFFNRFPMQFRILGLRMILAKNASWLNHPAMVDSAVSLSKYLWTDK